MGCGSVDSLDAPTAESDESETGEEEDPGLVGLEQPEPVGGLVGDTVLPAPAKSPEAIIFDQHALAAWLNFAKGSVKLTTLVDTSGDKTKDTTFGAAMLTAENVRANPASTSTQVKAQREAASRCLGRNRKDAVRRGLGLPGHRRRHARDWSEVRNLVHDAARSTILASCPQMRAVNFYLATTATSDSDTPPEPRRRPTGRWADLWR